MSKKVSSSGFKRGDEVTLKKSMCGFPRRRHFIVADPVKKPAKIGSRYYKYTVGVIDIDEIEKVNPTVHRFPTKYLKRV